MKGCSSGIFVANVGSDESTVTFFHAKKEENENSVSTTGTGLDTSKGGRPVGDPRMPSSSNADDQNTGGYKSSSGKSGNVDNESILMQSGVVRLQRAARAELQRRNEKALEEAAAAAAMGWCGCGGP